MPRLVLEWRIDAKGWTIFSKSASEGKSRCVAKLCLDEAGRDAEMMKQAFEERDVENHA